MPEGDETDEQDEQVQDQIDPQCPQPMDLLRIKTEDLPGDE